MGSVKRPVAGLIRPKRSENLKGSNSDINELIESDLTEEENQAFNKKLNENEEKDAALQLVNEFIENETRSSFNRKARRRAEEERIKSRLKRRDTHEVSSKIILNEFLENEARHTFEIKAKRRAEEEKLKSRLKRMDSNKALLKSRTGKREDKMEPSPYAEDQTLGLKTTPRVKTPTKHMKRSNKIQPSIPEAVQTSSPQISRKKVAQSRLPGDESEEIAHNSIMTLVMMAISLEGEYPAEFYQKMVESDKFKKALKHLDEKQRRLILAMMEDVAEPAVDYLPIQQNESFADNFKGYKLSVST